MSKQAPLCENINNAHRFGFHSRFKDGVEEPSVLAGEKLGPEMRNYYKLVTAAIRQLFTSELKNSRGVRHTNNRKLSAPQQSSSLASNGRIGRQKRVVAEEVRPALIYRPPEVLCFSITHNVLGSCTTSIAGVPDDHEPWPAQPLR